MCLGSLTINVFGREEFAVGDVLTVRNLKIRDGRYAIDDLSDVYCNDSVEYVLLHMISLHHNIVLV